MHGRYRQRFQGTEALRLVEEMLTKALRAKRLRKVLAGILTEDERTMIAQRLMVTFALTQGWSYRMITQEIGASPRTVARIHHLLKAENPNYRRLISLRNRRRTPPRRHQGTENSLLSLTAKGIFQSVTGTKL